jgi:F-type H+-transporting ATPase subunit gamma|tara:strand:+ start:1187 stop:2083 length:897 start_codon:yes stop_codon:yes gene_type:complete
MANLRDIRRRIKSVKSTSQITKAMELVSAAKMKKAQNQALAGRDYADRLNKVLVNLKKNTGEDSHPLLGKREGKKELMLVISTGRGLCGGLNTNLYKAVRRNASDDTEYVTVGKKLRQTIAKTGGRIVTDWDVADPVPFNDAKPISKFLTEQFLSGEYDKISVAFNNFVSTLTQTPEVFQLLPIESKDLGEKQDYEGVGKGEIDETDAISALSVDYEFEPDATGVLDKLLPLYINFQIYQMLVEARASEHSARMVAMKAASDNAKSMIKELTLDYNKARQAAITAELLEITTAMKAME